MRSPATRGRRVLPPATPTWQSRSVQSTCSQRSEHSCPARPPAQVHNPPNILIVANNEANREILETRLNAHGYHLLQAGNGEDAIEVVRQHAPDLILLDVMMPKVDGFEVCRRLKSDPELPFTPIVLVTAKAETRDIVA